MTTLIERLRERARDPKRARDEGRGGAFPPVEVAQIAEAETRLGFRLPPVLRQLYLQVGNGGFGPGTGIFSVPNAPREVRDSIVEHHPSETSWPAGLLPLCDWGCGILSCVDCSQSEAPIIRLDPNMPKGDVSERVPAAMRYARAARVSDACWVESASLEEWLEAWLNGAQLFYAAYGGAAEAESEEDGDEDE